MNLETARPPADRASAARTSAAQIVVGLFALVAAFAGAEHGIGELRQGSEAPEALVFESWPDTPAFDVLGGEPAMSIVPNRPLTGLLAIVASLAVAAWAVAHIRGRRSGLELIALSLGLLLVGGGFGPPAIGIILGLAELWSGRAVRPPPRGLARALARWWRQFLVLGVCSYLALVPGVVVLSAATGIESVPLVSALIISAFSALVLALLAGDAADRTSPRAP